MTFSRVRVRLYSLILSCADCLPQLLIECIKLSLYNLFVWFLQILSQLCLVLEEYLIQLHCHCLVDHFLSAWSHIEHTKLFIRNLGLYLNQIPQLIFKFELLSLDLLYDCFLLKLVKSTDIRRYLFIFRTHNSLIENFRWTLSRRFSGILFILICFIFCTRI